MNKEELLPGITAYYDINIDFDQLSEYYSNTEWQEAKVYAGAETDRKLRDASTKMFNDLSPAIRAEIYKYVDEYATRNGLEDLDLVDAFSLVKYNVGQFFVNHSDGGPGMPRRLSMVVYLNDDYEGGEISFTKFGIAFKMPKNTMILFPSTEEYSHAAEAVTDGTKHVLIGFWR
jgi:hypothetical protein